MMNTADTIKAYKKDNELSYETEELIDDPTELYDAAHSHADESEDVIYYHKAHELIRRASADEVGQAEDTFNECGMAGDCTYDGIAVQLAYWIVYYRYAEKVQAELESLRDWIENQESEDYTAALEAIDEILG